MSQRYEEYVACLMIGLVALIGRMLTVVSATPPSIQASHPKPELLAAAASVTADQMLNPPSSAVALYESDSPTDLVEGNDGSEAGQTDEHDDR